MSPATLHNQVGLYLDIEAGEFSEDEEEEEEVENEQEDQTNFLDDSADGLNGGESVTDYFGIAQSFYNEEPTLSLAELLKLKYVDRPHGRTSQHRDDKDDKDIEDWVGRLDLTGPRPDDWSLFEIRCVVGRELGLLLDLQTQFGPSDLRSAFASRSQGGLVYLEAHSLATHTKLSVFLRLHAATLKHRMTPSFDAHWNRYLPSLRGVRRITTEEWVSMLDRAAVPLKPAPKVGDPVQISKGLYRGDVGMVCNVEEEFCRVSVLLVPRLRVEPVECSGPGQKKRKRLSDRPPQALFSPQVMRSTFGSDSVETHNNDVHQHRFQGHTFQHGLLCRVVDVNSLCDTDAFMSATSARFFRESGHPQVMNSSFIVNPPAWAFQIGERVKMVNVEVHLTSGFICDVLSDRCMVKFSNAEGQDEGTHLIEKRHLRKVVETGDFVRVSCGEVAGTEGFVVAQSIDSPFIEVFHHTSEVRGMALDSYPQLILKDPHGIITATPAATLHPSLLDQQKQIIKQVYQEQQVTEYKTVTIHVNCVTRIAASNIAASTVAAANPPQSCDVKRIPRSYIPWQDMLIRVTRGPFKGRHGRIKDVNLAKSASGLRVQVEWEDHSPYISNACIWLDYDDVVDGSTLHRLADVEKPQDDSPFHLRPSYTPTVFSSLLILPSLTPNTPLQGNCTPMHEVGGDSPTWNASLDGAEREHSDDSALWLLDDRLQDKDVQVVSSTFGDDKPHLVRFDGSQLKTRKTSRQPWVTVPLHGIRLYRNSSLATHSRVLLLVIKGIHTGKYVRRVSYFYDKEKIPERRIAIVAVIDRACVTEKLTGEILELHPDNLAYTSPETKDQKRQGDELMRQLRDKYYKLYSNKAPVRHDFDSASL